jgi:hypothetical protein
LYHAFFTILVIPFWREKPLLFLKKERFCFAVPYFALDYNGQLDRHLYSRMSNFMAVDLYDKITGICAATLEFLVS